MVTTDALLLAARLNFNVFCLITSQNLTNQQLQIAFFQLSCNNEFNFLLQKLEIQYDSHR